MKKIFYCFCFCLIAFLASSCFSPWRGDSGNLTIVWGNPGHSRAGGSYHEEDLVEFSYKVTLNGPGGKIEQEFSSMEGASFSVIPGTWGVTVIGGIYGESIFEPIQLLVMGIKEIEVKAGEKKIESITLYNAGEVFSWGDLEYWLNDSYYCPDPTCAKFNYPHEQIILIKRELEAIEGSEDFKKSKNLEMLFENPLRIYRSIILVSEEPVIFKRDEGFTEEFFIVHSEGGSPSRLTLGMPGMSGTITIDGSDSGNNAEFVSNLSCQAISVGNNGELVMNRGVTIQNNNNQLSNGGAVFVSGTFTMNGGTIRNNSAGGFDVDDNSPRAGYGGGVYVDYDGKFIMNGGSITGNSVIGGAIDSPSNPSGDLVDIPSGKGGGVYVVENVLSVGGSTKNFIRNGGTISGNKPDQYVIEPPLD